MRQTTDRPSQHPRYREVGTNAAIDKPPQAVRRGLPPILPPDEADHP